MEKNKEIEEKELVFCVDCTHKQGTGMMSGCYHPDIIKKVNTPYQVEIRPGNINELNNKNSCQRFE